MRRANWDIKSLMELTGYRKGRKREKRVKSSLLRWNMAPQGRFTAVKMLIMMVKRGGREREKSRGERFLRTRDQPSCCQALSNQFQMKKALLRRQAKEVSFFQAYARK